MHKRVLLASLALILIAGVGVSIYRDFRSAKAEDTAESAAPETPVSTLSGADEGEESATQPTPEIIMTVNAGDPSVKPPPLGRPARALIAVSPSIAEHSVQEIQRLEKELTANPDTMTDWLLLGMYRKTLGDYRAAEEIWLYVAKKWPVETTAYNNLGDLYKEYLKEYGKAEAAFKAAIAADESYIYGYVNLFELYRFFYKEKASKAASVLEEGLVKNPQSIDLMVRLARYYADTGLDAAKAKLYYRKAITESERIGRADFAAKVRAEMEALGE